METVNPEHQHPPMNYEQEAGSFLTIMDEMAPQVALDYSVESLQRLDQFISEHFEPPGSKFVGETLPVGIGCYVGEVIIRHLGGHWNTESKPEVNDIGPIEAIFPIDKAIKRFSNGKQDSLAWYYHSIAKKAYEAGLEPKASVRPLPSSPVTAHQENQEGFMGLFKGLFKR
jgi:hypothetical protein